MKKNWQIFAFIFALSLLQAVVFNRLMLFRTKPDLLLISVVIMALYLKPNQALLFSAASGLLKDMYGAGAFGVHLLLFSLWCYLIIKLSRKIALDNDIVCVILVFLLDIIQNIFIRFVFLFSEAYIAWYVFLRIIFLESLYTVLIFPLVLRGFKFFKLHINR